MLQPATRERVQRTEPPLIYSAASCPAREHDHAHPRSARRARLPRPTTTSVAALPCTRARSRPASSQAPRDRPRRLSCLRTHGAYFAKTEGGHSRTAQAAPCRVAAPPRTDARRRDCGMHTACHPPERRAYREGCAGRLKNDQRLSVVLFQARALDMKKLGFSATYDKTPIWQKRPKF